ncbi:aspartyl-tRNA(Asn)/glutamyl-tRNA(Gln) amidotransferase subunit A [Actinomadura luteofluorescens]|uniref:Aspartyl-tRNA(Asn)/glutamyl-tRNA(Gln) amidotransferase subunit A n=1 Tax=Actinomadura luteofluorescens TaxID=46163 RepID=A0A7Y9JJX6_9ACTN|nr:amidase [Actinomadura luteofluorescens]NYD51967.1 aspartyl-tRNA(Asn)/glutamyl-tRNA(Gln) amidotransferase subunit A [Actinomadura luteofluorescens]
MNETEVTCSAPAGLDPSFIAISELGTLLAERRVSPTELCRSLLRRCERVEPRLNAFISLPADRIMADALAAERELADGRNRGPLHGIPVAVKDSLWTRGERTTSGALALEDFVPDHDATAVARLRAAGAIIFGKTNLPELGYGPVDEYHFGPTRNPWDPQRFSGGSSMGSGAAVAAGMVPGALGTDTTGSIRNPAAWSGVVGLKPTYGLVPLRGVTPLAASLDHIGPIARSAEDCALLLDVIAGHDPQDPTSAIRGRVPDYASALDGSVRNLRIGVLRDLWAPLPPDMARAMDRGLLVVTTLCERIGDVAVATWDSAAEAGPVLVCCEAAAHHRALLEEHGAELLPQVRERLLVGLDTPATDYVEAQWTAGEVRRELNMLFEEIDVLVLPSRESTAPRMDPTGHRLDSDKGPRYSAPADIAGLPAITIPCGFDDNGLPIGLQLIGRAWGERSLLALAYQFQRETDWHRKHPGLH